MVGVRDDKIPIAADDAVFFHMKVERMDPAAAAVANLPDVGASNPLLGERTVARGILEACCREGRVEGDSIDQPFDLAAETAALYLEDHSVIQHFLRDHRHGRKFAQYLGGGRHQAVIGSIVADHDLQDRDLVIGIKPGAG